MRPLGPRHATRAGETLGAALSRVALTVGVKSHLFRWDDPSPHNLPRFLPAGRTLRTANITTRTVEPNCTVSNIKRLAPLGTAILHRRSILARTTGIGASLDALPANTSGSKLRELLDTLGAQPTPDPSGRRPGLLFTISAAHPLSAEFIAYKRDFWAMAGVATTNAPAAQMNTSVSVTSGDREVLTPIAEAAHACGDPGLLFPMHCRPEPSLEHPGRMIRPAATSPCGELWLHDGEYCNLGNLVLPSFLREGSIDWNALAETTRAAVVFLDTVTDRFPTRCATPQVLFYRRIGLGVMGWASLLTSLAIPYDSTEARQLAGCVARFIYEHATSESETLAEKHGTALPPLARLGGGEPRLRRNVTVLALAPTGGTSAMIGNISASIEPHWSEAHRIDPADHIAMAAAWQKWVDNGVSKTVNLPHTASTEDIIASYQLAHDFRLKGITVFRDRCISVPGPIACNSCQ